MKVSYNWLKEFVECEIHPEELAERLSLAGVEVERVEAVGDNLEGITVGKIISCQAEKGNSRGKWCRISLGRRKLTLFSGAPNLKMGAKVAVALPSSTVGGQKVKVKKIGGKISRGLLCCEKDLGLGEDDSGILLLPSSCKPGNKLAAALGLPDHVLEIEVTPNRPDLLGIRGVAREVAALTGRRLKSRPVRVREKGPPIGELTSVVNREYSLCPRYCARLLRGLKIKPAPFLIRHRLFISGIRSINNVVDATNYLLLELGQPLHAFDFNTLSGRRIVVRRAFPGEDIVTIDDTDRKLEPDQLVIADGEKAVAIAGIMGGRATEVGEATTDVLLESACFDPVSVRRTSKKLALVTEASKRFERGADPEAAPEALQLASALIIKLAGGSASAGWIDKKRRSFQRTSVSLSLGRAESLLGVKLTARQVSGYLTKLGLIRELQRRGKLRFKVPTWRPDLTREVDLLEEVARLYGYDRIPALLPVSQVIYHKKDVKDQLLDDVLNILCGLGLDQVITYSFMNPGEMDRLRLPPAHPLRRASRIANPVNREQGFLRTTLIPGMLRVLRRNLNQGVEKVEIFELGKVFFRAASRKLPEEHNLLTLVLRRPSKETSWGHLRPPLDFFDIKGLLELVCRRLGMEGIDFLPVFHPAFQPGQSAEVRVGEKKIGTAGRLSAAVAEDYGVTGPVYLAELNFDAIAKDSRRDKKYRPLALYPGVGRDIALIVERSLPFRRIREAVEESRPGILESYRLFDIYEGKPLKAGEKSVALSLHYRSPYGTLLEKQVNQAHQEFKKALARKLQCGFRE